MLEMIKQEALQLEPVMESYGACKFSHTFPMEKLFNYIPLNYSGDDSAIEEVEFSQDN